VIVTEVETPTGDVVTANVAVFTPAGTATFAGTVAAVVFELTRPTRAPPAGALLVRVTVPVEEPPPRTLVGESESDEIGLGGAGSKSATARRASTRRTVPATRGLIITPPLAEPERIVGPIAPGE
jgi:hypothetical protein